MQHKLSCSPWYYHYRHWLWVALAFAYGLIIGGFGILLGVAGPILHDWAISTDISLPQNMPLYRWGDDFMGYFLAGWLSFVVLLILSLLLGIATSLESKTVKASQIETP